MTKKNTTTKPQQTNRKEKKAKQKAQQTNKQPNKQTNKSSGSLMHQTPTKHYVANTFQNNSVTSIVNISFPSQWPPSPFCLSCFFRSHSSTILSFTTASISRRGLVRILCLILLICTRGLIWLCVLFHISACFI